MLGISIGSRHDDWLTVTQTRWGERQLRGARLHRPGQPDPARRAHQLERDVARLGADGVVVQDMNMRVRERECPMQEGRRDHIVEATIIGTAIARFASASGREARTPLAIMSLDPQRRQAARVRLGP